MIPLRLVVINKREVFAQSDGQRYAKSGVGVCLLGVKSFRHHGAHVAVSSVVISYSSKVS